jgi:hypothetical protein
LANIDTLADVRFGAQSGHSGQTVPNAVFGLDGPFTTRMSISLAGSLKLAEQNQDQHDNEDEAEPAANIVAGPVKRAAT